MKKFTKTVSVFLFGLILFTTTSAYAASLSAIMSAVKGANEVAQTLIKIYDKVPEAQYEMAICTNGQPACETITVNSCARALMKAKVALRNGATDVTISTVYPSIHPSCSDKSYSSANQLPF